MFKNTSRIFKRRIFATCFALAIALLWMSVMSTPRSNALPVNAAVTVAAALPGSSVEIEYYTNATYTVQCGYKYISCNGQTFRSGCITSFKISYSEPCP
jgi:hypothetical protein